MEYEFLRRLYFSCSQQGSSVCADGLNLPELYKRIEETDRSEWNFAEELESTGLDFDKKGKLEEKMGEGTTAYELQGFINGFRLCGLLLGEIRALPTPKATDTALTAELLEAVRNTDTWRAELVDDQSIQAAQKALSETLIKIVGNDQEDKIMEQVFEYVEAVEGAAILYGMRVADALRGGQFLPAANVGA